MFSRSNNVILNENEESVGIRKTVLDGVHPEKGLRIILMK
jgi:hypothetical protein